MQRRTVLAATGLTLFTPLVGCLESPAEESESESVDSWEYDVADSAPSLAFDTVGPDGHSLAVHVNSAEEAEKAFTYESLSDDARQEAKTFVEETEFETAVLFYVETRAPDDCHSLRVQSLDVSDDDVLTGSMESRDTSDDDHDCPTVETTPSLAVRVTAEPGLPSHAELDVTDGWEETEQVTSVSASEKV